MTQMLSVKEAPSVDERVAIEAVNTLPWEAHSDDVWTNIRQVEVEAVFCESKLVCRDEAFDEIPSLAGCAAFDLFELLLCLVFKVCNTDVFVGR